MMIETELDFQTYRDMGWSGCMHDSDCACSPAVMENDNKVFKKWKKAKKDEKETAKLIIRNAYLNLERAASELERQAKSMRIQASIYEEELDRLS